MSRLLTHEAMPVALPMRAPTGLLQRKCACGNHSIAGGDCESCQKEKSPLNLQRAASRDEPVNDVPPIVHDVLRSSGQPLDLTNRAFFESRFGHDFSSVRIHRDAKAAESALAVNAMAYTVGNDVVFEAGRYAPDTRDGRRLLAHELTHVVQQRSASPGISGKLKVGAADDASERAADAAAQTIAAGGQVEVAPSRAAGVLQRQLGQERQDPIHRPVIEDFRRKHGLPKSGRDQFGNPVGPTDAQIKYELNRPVEDPSRIRIDAVPDFLASSLKAPRKVQVHVNDSQVVAIRWDLMNPEGRTVATTSTTAAQANATTQPFDLDPAHFSATNFVAGQYVLYCFGRDGSNQEVVYARRDFNVLSEELKKGQSKDTPYGQLTFTRYDSVNANIKDPNPKYEIAVTLEFLPKQKVSCNDVAFIQAVQSLTADGQSQLHLAHPDIAARQTKLSWSIDQLMDARSPYFDILPPQKNASPVPRASPGHPGSGGKQPSKAQLRDEPGGQAPTGFKSLQPEVTKFESCLICRSGTNMGQAYGCATWGFTTDASWQVKMMPPSFRPMPSETFMEAAAGWNIWRDTKPPTQRPDEIPALKSPPP